MNKIIKISTIFDKFYNNSWNVSCQIWTERTWTIKAWWRIWCSLTRSCPITCLKFLLPSWSSNNVSPKVHAQHILHIFDFFLIILHHSIYFYIFLNISKYFNIFLPGHSLIAALVILFLEAVNFLRVDKEKDDYGLCIIGNYTIGYFNNWIFLTRIRYDLCY